MTNKEIESAIAAAFPDVCRYQVSIWPGRATIDFDGFDITFQQLLKLGEALGTDRINVKTESGYYGESSHILEVLW